ncbi:MAG: hypothetical protein LUH05_07090 [Candidatus Gastranaerophilales bacterium]|nr:hypothetical protein [Candidatus Gastranaerophilales bacterium]
MLISTKNQPNQNQKNNILSGIKNYLKKPIVKKEEKTSTSNQKTELSESTRKIFDKLC